MVYEVRLNNVVKLSWRIGGERGKLPLHFILKIERSAENKLLRKLQENQYLILLIEYCL